MEIEKMWISFSWVISGKIKNCQNLLVLKIIFKRKKAVFLLSTALFIKIKIFYFVKSSPPKLPELIII